MTEAKTIKDITRETGQKLVSLCSAGNGTEAVETLYDEKIVSIEAEGTEELPARMEGLEAIRGKNNWWYDNHEVHGQKTEGPFCGPHENQFGARFEMDVTFKPTGVRSTLIEFALFTVAESEPAGTGKIVQEEFWYHVD